MNGTRSRLGPHGRAPAPLPARRTTRLQENDLQLLAPFDASPARRCRVAGSCQPPAPCRHIAAAPAASDRLDWSVTRLAANGLGRWVTGARLMLRMPGDAGGSGGWVSGR